MRIQCSPHSASDLKSISEYIEQDRSSETANRVARAIYNATQSLGMMPLRHRAWTGSMLTPGNLLVRQRDQFLAAAAQLNGDVTQGPAVETQAGSLLMIRASQAAELAGSRLLELL